MEDNYLPEVIQLLSFIAESTTSPALKQTLALIMLDACTGKVCLSHRAATLGNNNDLLMGGTKILNGPLGASYGNDMGNTIFTSASELSLPAAKAVNDGAKRGLRLLRTAGKPIPPNKLNQKKPPSNQIVVQVAQFATSLWRTINGELGGRQSIKDKNMTFVAATSVVDGVCAFDGYLRCSLLSLWQYIWQINKSKGQCPAVIEVQSWKEKAHIDMQRYKDLGADEVMSVEDREKMAAKEAVEANVKFRKIYKSEIDRQRWRGEMAKKLKDAANAPKDKVAASQGLNQPLEIVDKDDAWKLGKNVNFGKSINNTWIEPFRYLV